MADADRLQPLKGGVAMAAVEADRSTGGAELLKLAAAQRMSTDARRAAFCVVMGSEDFIDASDRLLRLPLKVSQPQAYCLSLPRCFSICLKLLVQHMINGVVLRMRKLKTESICRLGFAA